MKLIRTISFVILIVAVFGLQAQDLARQTKLIAVDALHEDIAILKYNLEQIHAGLYNYTPKELMDQKFNDIKSEITTPLTSIEFYRRLVNLHQKIKNGHTIIIPSENFDQATATTTPSFPLDVYWEGDKVYILRNNSEDTTLVPGTRIDSINGKSATAVFLQLSQQWTRDGNNTTFPEGITQRAFAGFYINFIGTPTSYQLVLEDSQGTNRTTELKALLVPQIDQERKARYGEIHDYWQEGEGDAVTLDIKDGIAHLQIKTCATSDIRKFGRSIRRMMNNYFDLIAQQAVEHLIVDLRNNGGGNDIIGRELLRHIALGPFTQFDDSRLITRKIPNKAYYSENISMMNIFAKVGIKKGNDGFYRLNALGKLAFRSGGLLKEFVPVKDRYSGNIYTLTNEYSFSAAGELAALIKVNTNSIFVGEEPGGNSTHVVAGEMFTLTLPNSKNRVRVPVVQSRVSAEISPADHGILPDHEVRNSIEDVLNGRDGVLEYTVKLINELEK